MKTILLLNHKQERCGIYQYGLRLSEILKKSDTFNFLYYEIDNINEHNNIINSNNIDIIIYNYQSITMPFLNEKDIKKYNNIKHVYIHHFGDYNNMFDFILETNPNANETNKLLSLLRPIYENLNLEYKKNDIITIGSFGFGYTDKGFDRICSLVNEQFDKAIINLHITFSYYADNNGDIAKNYSNICRNLITKKDIVLNITHDFLDNNKLLNFLSNNDINMFLYDNRPRGISSVTDYAISVNRPIAINKTCMFQHIHNITNDFCIEYNSINDIINNYNDASDFFREKWSHKNTINKVNELIIKLHE